jgi:hypothetical protein
MIGRHYPWSRDTHIRGLIRQTGLRTPSRYAMNSRRWQRSPARARANPGMSRSALGSAKNAKFERLAGLAMDPQDCKNETWSREFEGRDRTGVFI